MVEVVKRRSKDRRRECVENQYVDVWVRFHQSNHRHPLPWLVWLLVPFGRALIVENLGTSPMLR